MIVSKVGRDNLAKGSCCWGYLVTCENKVNSYSVQLKVELGLQGGEEFDKMWEDIIIMQYFINLIFDI